MNIRLSFGLLSLYLENVSTETVDTLQRGVLCDYTYRDSKKVEFVCDNQAELVIVANNSTPTITRKELDKELEDGSQD